MFNLLQKGAVAAFDRYMRSPFRRKHYEGQVDVEAIQWAISLLEIHDGVKVNPNSQYWLDRLRANLHHHKLDQRDDIHGGSE